ncbi:bifunctional YncE family protein/alkaline phosphatase family protein [Pirellulaceae bacterium SH467]
MASRNHLTAAAKLLAITVIATLTPEALSQSPIKLPGIQNNGQTLLPNGWSLKPVGEQLALGDFPSLIRISPDGKFAAILHTGYGAHEVRMVDTTTKKQVSSIVIDQAFYGMRFSKTGDTLFVTGAEDERIYVFKHENGYLSSDQTIQIVEPKETFVATGIDFHTPSAQWIVCGMYSHQLAFVPSKKSDGEQTSSKLIDLPKDSFPFEVVIGPDDKFAYVSLWGHAAVAQIDIAKGQIAQTWDVHSHPTEMLFLDEGKYLLVSCADDNSVVLIDTSTGNQKEVIRTSLYHTAKNGSTPNSISVSGDGGVLAVANADNNNVALFDIRTRGQSKSLGFIPVGWYPTSVRFSKDSNTILVTNGKGITPKDNEAGPNPLKEPPKTIREYIGGLFQGTLSFIPSPSPEEMARWTKDAYANSPLQADNKTNATEFAKDSAIPSQVGETSPIKHCFYIVKENRTYDQVFGDVAGGNGDPNLCIFPERVTPNHHSLAKEFVLLDNFYVESEVSADGHEWSMAAYATDYVERTWPLTYRGGRRKIGYPSEGNVDIAAPSSGYIWDQCKKAGVNYFSFGEFIENAPVIGQPSRAKVAALEGHYDPMYRGYDLDYMDIDRAKRFAEVLAQFEKNDNLPQFIVLRIGNDHTSGTRVGKKTPTAMVADNDVALGMIVESISNSRYWEKSAIFVVEDDAQNGSDHVDAHRTVALAISPFIRKGTVDSTLYTTSSMLRTMELILGLAPMTQFDAAATPMYRSFGNSANPKPYTHLAPNVDLYETNTPLAWGAKRSEELDFTKEDAADDLLLGEIVWRSVRGASSPMPPPVRAGFVFAEAE